MGAAACRSTAADASRMTAFTPDFSPGASTALEQIICSSQNTVRPRGPLTDSKGVKRGQKGPVPKTSLPARNRQDRQLRAAPARRALGGIKRAGVFILGATPLAPSMSLDYSNFATAVSA